MRKFREDYIRRKLSTIRLGIFSLSFSFFCNIKIKINSSTIVFVVLNGVKTSTPKLREEHELWEFEIWSLSKRFGCKKRQQEECGINQEKLYDFHV
jgi:hypothetical protein